MLKAWNIHYEHRWAIYTSTDPIILPSPPSPQSTPQATLSRLASYLSRLSTIIAKTEARSRCVLDEEKAEWGNFGLNREHCAPIEELLNLLAKEDGKLDATIEQAYKCQTDAERQLIQ